MSEDRIGSLYFLQAGEFGPIKIGWTSGHVSHRMRQIQEASPCELRWIGAQVAPFAAEKAAHLELKDYRFRGEWFHPVIPVRAFIERAAPGWDELAYVRDFAKTDLLGRFIRATRYRSVNRQVVARRLGISVGLLYDWVDRFTAPPAPVEKIAEALDLIEAGALEGAEPPYTGPGRDSRRLALVAA